MKKDPDAYRAKMEAMEAARMRMQEKYNQVDKTFPQIITTFQFEWKTSSNH